MVTWREELAWAAGFFDGEGTVGTRFPKPGQAVIGLGICQCDTRVLERFRDAVGVGAVYELSDINFPPNQRKQWQYSTGSLEGAQAVIALMWTWLGPVKREQASTALQRHHAHTDARRKARAERLAQPCRYGHGPDWVRYVSVTRRSPRYYCRVCERLRQAAWKAARKSTSRGAGW